MTAPPRTWLDLASGLPLNYLIALGDQIIRIPRPGLEQRSEPYAYKDGLRLLIRQHPNMKGVEKARLALDETRVGGGFVPGDLSAAGADGRAITGAGASDQAGP